MNIVSRIIISVGCLIVIIGLSHEQIELGRLAKKTKSKQVLTWGVLSRNYSDNLTNKFSFGEDEH